MHSQIPGFEYDIFISYRHNDNRSGWVTDFVNALQEELAATIKEPLSIYFDKNPHDGLLETHNVDKSLEGKLKCSIFIPIISQTYCDPNSFAWKNEFCVFNRLSTADEFGRDIRLGNGNVASRILPIKIHDLDPDDKKTIEVEIGGVLRPIEFIYKSAGVNRPLRASEERPTDNLNKTQYRDQINKTANAIKEVLTAFKNSQHPKPESDHKLQETKASSKTKYAGVALALLIILVSSYFLYPKIISLSTIDETDKSIAVLPFTNLSEDKGQEYFSDGMVDEVLNQLVKVHDLKVISRTSSMSFKNSPLTLKEIASQLGAAHILEGSVRKMENKVRITVQLIEAKTDNHLWSETYDRDLDDIFKIQTEISKNIARELKLIVSPSTLRQIEKFPTVSQEAYDLYLRANLAFDDDRSSTQEKIIDQYTRAIKLDSNFALAYLKRCETYALIHFNRFNGWEGKLELAKNDFEIARGLVGNTLEVRSTEAYLLWMDSHFQAAADLYEKLKSEYPNKADIYGNLAGCQRRLGDWGKVRENYETSIQLDPSNASNRYEYSRFLHTIRDYEKANEIIALAKGSRYDAARESAKFTLTGNPQELTISPRDALIFNRRFDERLSVIDTSRFDTREFSTVYYPKSLDRAEVFFFKNEKQQSAKFANEAIKVLNEKIKDSPGDERIYMALGFAYGYAGMTENAIRMGRKAVEMAPMESDVFFRGPVFQTNLARLYIICGKYDLAMDRIEWLLSVPGPLSKSILRADPSYDALRGLPRFSKILTTDYKTQL